MHVSIIAEIGINHDGSMQIAKQLIDGAFDAGADFVKFQFFNPDTLALDNADLKNLEKYALCFSDFVELKKYCDLIGIGFLCTPFDVHTADAVNNLGVHAIKISSGNLSNKILLKKVSSFGKPLIVSTGMHSISEIQDAFDYLLFNPSSHIVRNDITLLHCRSIYPTPTSLSQLSRLRNLFLFTDKVGFSDHSLSCTLPAAAVAMGACVIEKHITMDRNLPGADHAASLNLDEFRSMSFFVREIELALGDGRHLAVLEEEKFLRKIWDKKINKQNRTR